MVQSPVRLPKGPSELMEKVEEKYQIFFKLWNTSYIPKLIKSSKWYKMGEQLVVGDIVFFKKTEGALASDWIVGKVIDVIKSKDDVVRKVEIQYQNASENIPRYTTRAARSLVKLFNVEDSETWTNDMDEVEKLMKTLSEEKLDDSIEMKKKLKRQVGVTDLPQAAKARSNVVKRFKCSKCCCKSHCSLTGHGKDDVIFAGSCLADPSCVPKFPGVMDNSWRTPDEYEYAEFMEEFAMEMKPNMMNLTTLLASTNMDFDDVEL